MSPKIYIDRPPRIEPELPAGVRPIPNPPDIEERPGELLSQAFLPLMMIFGYILVAAMGQGRNLTMMIPMLLSVIGSIGLAIYTRRKEARRREELANIYMRRLSELRQQMESEHEQQRIYYHYNYPHPEKSLQIVADTARPITDRQEDIRSGTRLWERHPNDHDFMHLRLGIASRPSTVVYTSSEKENTDSPLTLEALRLAQDSSLLLDAPVTIVLYQLDTASMEEKVAQPDEKTPDEGKKKERKSSTVRHSLGITGKPELVRSYIRSLLVYYATFHSPEDTILYIAGTVKARDHWRWAYDLPHCKKADQSETLCFEQEREPAENETDHMRLFWKGIRTLLERRRMRLQDKENNAGVKLPFLLIVVDLLDPTPDWSCLKIPEADAAIATILLDGQKLGAAIIFLNTDRAAVPGRCNAIIETDIIPGDERTAVFRYAETGFDTLRYIGHEHLINREQTREFSRRLEPLDIRRGYGSSLADTVTLLEMLKLTSIDEIQKMALENWRRSKDPAQADWLRSAIGLLSGNEPRLLTFSAKDDGVHGIIAGSTGSGKSELLMTLIIGLALNYSPDVLNFVLIDYKGGAAFDPFKRLPHKVDIVTNLDQAATARVFASIIAELDRRQKLNTNTNSKDIVHYRQKGLNLDIDRPPYPHLFIIIDEFAEMIAGNAEYKAQLESITRLGRALGVTLILAAQRPAGVTDQMRANIKFRICLRVETPDDSREVLRRSDAAFLPPGIPGRGYLQIGNENIELIQTAYCGGDYTGPEEQNVIPNIIWIDRPKKSAVQKGVERPKLYDVIVETLSHLAIQESHPQWRPWPEFLPTQAGKDVLCLDTPIDTAYMSDSDIELLRFFSDNENAEGPTTLNALANDFWENGNIWPGTSWGKNSMCPIVGLIDNPYQATQRPLAIEFKNGHAVIFGASGRGKTTFLRTTVTSLVLAHAPNELHIYILDFGGRALSIFQDLPHVGAVITAEEDERVQRLLRKVKDIVSSRQKMFSEERTNDLDAYNQAHPGKILPAVLVVIDNFAEFREYYDALMGWVVSLAREARAYGVYFLISADVPAALTGKLMNFMVERFTLKLSDPTEYSGIVGRGAPADLSNVFGRGYVRVGNQPLEFQTALAFKPKEGEGNEIKRIGEMVDMMKMRWNDAWGDKMIRPYSIDTLPLSVSLEQLTMMTGHSPSKRLTALLGIDDRNLKPYWLDLENQGPHMVIIGQPNSGKTTTLRTILFSIAEQHSPSELLIVLVDFSPKKFWRGAERSLGELAHVVNTVGETDELDDLLENLCYECGLSKRRKILILIDNYDTFTDEASRKKTTFFEGLAGLVRKYQTAGFSVVIAGSLAVTSAADDLRKIVSAPNLGLALRTSDAVNRLNGRFPRSLAESELPMGRAFKIRSGVTDMIQIASPYSTDDEPENDLDAWVRKINTCYPGQKARWQRPIKANPDKESPATKSTRKGTVQPHLAPVTIPQKAPETKLVKSIEEYNIPVIKELLRQRGMPDLILDELDAQAIIDNARDWKLIDQEADE